MNTITNYSETTQNKIAAFQAALEEDNFKARLLVRDAKWLAEKGDQPPPEPRRTVETVQGFLTKERVKEMLVNPDEDQLLFTTGLAIISNGKAFFLSDDGSFGLKTLQDGFAGVGFPDFQYEIGPGKRYADFDDWMAKMCRGEVYLSSVKEVAEWYVQPNTVTYRQPDFVEEIIDSVYVGAIGTLPTYELEVVRTDLDQPVNALTNPFRTTLRHKAATAIDPDSMLVIPRQVHISNIKEKDHVTLAFETFPGSGAGKSVTRHYVQPDVIARHLTASIDNETPTYLYRDQSLLAQDVNNFLNGGDFPPMVK